MGVGLKASRGGELDNAGAQEGGRRWSFASAEFDESTFELRVRQQAVAIERKALEVLKKLLLHAGELVTKDELLESVWPGRIVSESIPAKCVSRIRKVIGDDNESVIKTVHGYGYRLMAPVRVEVQRAESQARFAFRTGDHPPGRLLWSLVRRLGTGGHGEAWLGQHDKTREQRVFKFAIDGSSLVALKREITLYRLLKDSLGEQARAVELFDWNLESNPCFAEYRYMAGGSLVDWAERHGKLRVIPLATRLDVAAQICDALAAVHSIGVLHKDLKPSNILVEDVAGTAPAIRLADFGSASLLDPRRLELLGITRLGFTRTVSVGEKVSGTLLYAAPEVLAGQPFTVKADIYALGVVLYQLVIGDFHASLSPGWEHGIDDELLREYISAAAQGESERRAGDAGDLGQRLRSLEHEREKRRLDRETREKAEALKRALELAETSRAVADFLSTDLFAVVSSRPLRDLSVRELLDSASGKLEDRFKELPAAAAQIHEALGRAFLTMEALEQAEKHLGLALDFHERQEGSGSEKTATIAAQLIQPKFQLGRLVTALPRYCAILAQAQALLGSQNPAVVDLKIRLAQARFTLGHWRAATEEFRQLVATAKSMSTLDNSLVASANYMLGFALLRTGSFEASVVASRECISQQSTLGGVSQVPIAHARLACAVSLMELERFDEAELELNRALDLVLQWAAGEQDVQVLTVRFGFGQLRLRQGRLEEAIATFEQICGIFSASSGIKGTDQTGELRMWLAQAYREAGRLDEAEANLRRALSSNETILGPANPLCLSARIALADILRLRGQLVMAMEMLATVDRGVLSEQGPHHPYLAELHRVQGLTALAGQRTVQAREALTDAAQLFEACYGPRHAFARRARAELAEISAPPLA